MRPNPNRYTGQKRTAKETDVITGVAASRSSVVRTHERDQATWGGGGRRWAQRGAGGGLLGTAGSHVTYLFALEGKPGKEPTRENLPMGEQGGKGKGRGLEEHSFPSGWARGKGKTRKKKGIGAAIKERL